MAKPISNRARLSTIMDWLTERPHLWRGTGTIGPHSERKLQIFRLMQAANLYSKTTLWTDTNIETLVNYLRRRQPHGIIAKARARRVKEQFGILTTAQWTTLTLPEKSKLIFEMWQIPHACERLGATLKVRFEVDLTVCFLKGVDPLPEDRLVTLDVDPAQIPEDERSLIGERLEGGDLWQLSQGRFGRRCHRSARILSATPDYAGLMDAIREDEREVQRILKEWMEEDAHHRHYATD